MYEHSHWEQADCSCACSHATYPHQNDHGDDDDYDKQTISIFAIDFNARYVDQEINAKKLLKDFGEKFLINNVEKW